MRMFVFVSEAFKVTPNETFARFFEIKSKKQSETKRVHKDAEIMKLKGQTEVTRYHEDSFWSQRINWKKTC